MNPTENKHQLEVTTPGDCEIVMTRVFDAPRDTIFGAFTKPERMALVPRAGRLVNARLRR